jgi:hypothetical protein
LAGGGVREEGELTEDRFVAGVWAITPAVSAGDGGGRRRPLCLGVRRGSTESGATRDALSSYVVQGRAQGDWPATGGSRGWSSTAVLQ